MATMLSQDYLTLHLTRLQALQSAPICGEGLHFIVVKAGSGALIAGGNTERMKPGDLLALECTSSAEMKEFGNGEFVFWSFSIKFEHLYPLFATEEICLLQNLRDHFKTPRLFPASTKLGRECHKLIEEVPPQFSLDHRSHLLRIVGAVLTCEFRNIRTQRTGFIRMDEHLVQVLEKLSIDEMLSLSVGELASRFGCSRRHLNRLFNQHFGFSVASLRMEMRLLKAVALLRDPDVKVFSVADQCGFNHLGLFNTCFKRRFGKSPGQWRKMSLSGPSQQSPEAQDNSCQLQRHGLCPWASANPCPPSPASRVAARKVPTSPTLALTRGIDEYLGRDVPPEAIPQPGVAHSAQPSAS